MQSVTAGEKPVEQRSAQANWQRIRRAEGNCPRCGNKCDFNGKRGKPFSHCAICRPLIADAQKRLMRQRRAAVRA